MHFPPLRVYVTLVILNLGIMIMKPPAVPAVPAVPDLTSFKYADLFKTTDNELSAISWCQNNGLIAKDRKYTCGSPTEMRERQTEKKTTGKSWFYGASRCRYSSILQIIHKHMAPGTTIISDLWAVYKTLGT